MTFPLRSANRRTIREINQALVLGTIRDRGPISRTDVAETAGLSPATVSGITGALLAEGLIVKVEGGVSTGGRRPTLLALNRRAGLVVGAKLAETQLVVALTDLGAAVVDRREAPLGDDRRPEAVVAVLAETVDALRAAHPGRRLFGLGLGLAGVVDRAAGVCRFSPFLRWRDVPLRRLLEDRLALPVVLENDVNALATAERWFGAGVGVEDFLVVTLGRGVGLGIVIGGRAYRGGCGGGGEFGHVTVDPDGPVCDCGKRGCLEALVADPALLRRLREALGRDLTMSEAIALARGGEPTACSVFAAAGRTLGLALAWLVNVFNPPLLIVGGEGAGALDLLMDPLRDALRANCFDGCFDDLRLVVEPWGDDAWALGAASLMLEELFRPAPYRDDGTRVSWGAAVVA